MATRKLGRPQGLTRNLKPNIIEARQAIATTGKIALFIQLHNEEAAALVEWCELQNIERVDLGVKLLCSQHFGPYPDVSIALTLRREWEARAREKLIAAFKSTIVDAFSEMRLEEGEIATDIQRIKGEIA